MMWHFTIGSAVVVAAVAVTIAVTVAVTVGRVLVF